MKRIEETLKALQKTGRAALIPYIMAGDPDLKTTGLLIRKMAESGAQIIEVGVPFSDPLADGPTIQAAAQRALRNGVHLEDLFNLVKNMKGTNPPLVLMTYFNPVLQFGLKAFAAECRGSGIDAVIIPDLPPEEARPWVAEARRSGVDTVFLVAPTSPPERIRLVSRMSQGFIYYVSVTGVTGMRDELPAALETAVRRVQESSGKPVAVGFGISTPAQAREVSRFADGVIVGSAIVKMIAEAQDESRIDRVGAFVSSLAAAMK